LHNQDDLVSLRTQAGVHRLRPGLTGLAQISGRDELSVEEKVELDQRYLAERNLFFDVKVLLRTIVPVISGRSLV
jgi:O-antigen biosynthesis protein WbqP